MNVKEIESNLVDLINTYRKHLAFIDLSHIDGFFTALCCTKEVIKPSAWIPALWHKDRGEPNWESDEEFNQFIQTMMDYYNLVVGLISRDDYAPAIYERHDGKPDLNFWCFGFLHGAKLWNRSILTTEEAKFIDKHIAIIQKFSEKGNAKMYNAASQEEAMEIYKTIKTNVKLVFDYLEKKRTQENSPILH